MAMKLTNNENGYVHAPIATDFNNYKDSYNYCPIHIDSSIPLLMASSRHVMQFYSLQLFVWLLALIVNCIFR